MREDTAYVLDLGTSKTACLAAHLDEVGHLRVDSAAVVPSRGIAKGVITDPEAVAESITAVLDRLKHDLHDSIDRVIVGIGGAHVSGVEGRGVVPIYPAGREVRREDVLQVINHSRQLIIAPEREQVLAVPSAFRIDGGGSVADPIGRPATRLEVSTHIVTAEGEHVAALESTLEQAGLGIEQVVALPMASGLGCLTEDEIESGTVVVDIGAGTTSVAAFVDGSLAYLATIPVGSSHITSDVRQLLKVSEEEADRLKVNHGCALAGEIRDDDAVQVTQQGETQSRPLKRRVLCEIIESRAREIAAMCAAGLESGDVAGKVSSIVLTGGGAGLSEIDKLFAQSFGLPKHRVGQPRITGHSSRTAGPPLSAAVGLARYALEGDEQEFAPVSGIPNWKHKIRTLKSLFSGTA